MSSTVADVTLNFHVTFDTRLPLRVFLFLILSKFSFKMYTSTKQSKIKSKKEEGEEKKLIARWSEFSLVSSTYFWKNTHLHISMVPHVSVCMCICVYVHQTA